MPKQLLDKDNNLLYSGYETEEIVANPQLDGTEGNLTGLQIGDTKYVVPQGGGGEIHLYQHFISINFHNYNSYGIIATCKLSILNGSQEDITIQDIRNYLYLEDGGYIATTGYMHYESDRYPAYAIARYDEGEGVCYHLDTTDGSTWTFEDNTDKTDSNYQHWYDLKNFKTIQII